MRGSRTQSSHRSHPSRVSLKLPQFLSVTTQIFLSLCPAHAPSTLQIKTQGAPGRTCPRNRMCLQRTHEPHNIDHGLHVQMRGRASQIQIRTWTNQYRPNSVFGCAVHGLPPLAPENEHDSPAIHMRCNTICAASTTGFSSSSGAAGVWSPLYETCDRRAGSG